VSQYFEACFAREYASIASFIVARSRPPSSAAYKG